MFIVFHIMDYLPKPGPQSIPQGGMQSEVDPSLKIEFVKKPPDDIYSPVTFGVLLQPQQTRCCGKHLLKEVAVRIQPTGRGRGLSAMQGGRLEYHTRQILPAHSP